MAEAVRIDFKIGLEQAGFEAVFEGGSRSLNLIFISDLKIALENCPTQAIAKIIIDARPLTRPSVDRKNLQASAMGISNYQKSPSARK